VGKTAVAGVWGAAKCVFAVALTAAAALGALVVLRP